MADPIVTVGDLTDHLSGDKQKALDAATALVRDYCGWHVTPEQEETLTARGTGSSVLQLPSLRVVSVTSVTDERGTVLDSSSYEVDPAGMLRGRRWTGVYTVALKHGYAEAPALAQVILRTAARGIQSPDGSTPTSVSLGSASIGLGSPGSSSGSFPQSDMATLDRYRLPPLP